MGRFALTTEPMISGSQLSWGATLDPGTFEQVPQGEQVDILQIFRMSSDDGMTPQAEWISQIELGLPHDVMPGDSYRQSADLGDLHDGYYHVMHVLDVSETHELHVTVHGGMAELKSYHRTA